MAKKKSSKTSESELPFEMNALLEGMQELLMDEYGNPLPPDHPQYKKVMAMVEHMSEILDHPGSEDQASESRGHA